ncbi:MAG: stage II sporulation protein M [Planctomycetia bacterium]|nr:stage II sporulation protein M [Planctomycetia bacterium]
MSVASLLEARAAEWAVLADDIAWLRGRVGRPIDAERAAAFARRYRAACSDLALAAALNFPPATREHLQQLVADAHTQLYRIESFSLIGWLRSLLVDVPRRVVSDPCFWIALAIFWSVFLGALAAAATRPGFAAEVAGEGMLAKMEEMYSQRPGSGGFAEERSIMTGFYVFNNAGIGLRCFAGGILCGVGSLVVLAFNALFLGVIFGHMLVAPQAGNFTEFVTAHGPFELTAVVLSAAAGLRLGWSILDTRGWARMAALRRAAPDALEIVGLATVLFFLAAFIEGFVSPSRLPYAAKAGVAILSAALLVGYFLLPVLLPGRARDAA